MNDASFTDENISSTVGPITQLFRRVPMTDVSFKNENISSKDILVHSSYCTLASSYETTQAHDRTFF
jgi:hypothetical protein